MIRNRPRTTGAHLLIWAAVALISLGLLAPVAAAEGADPRIVAAAGAWGPTVTPGMWTPIAVDLEGGEHDRQVTLEAVLQYAVPVPGTGGPNQPPETRLVPMAAYGRLESVAAGVAKQAVLWVPMGYGNSVTVQLRDGEEVLAQQPLEFGFGRAGWPLIGVLGDDGALAQTVRRIELTYEGLAVPPDLAELQPASTPDNSQWLQSLAALVVQGSAPADLTHGQREAVRQWVAAGGHLVIAGGPTAAESLQVLPPDTLPLSVLPGGRGSLAELAVWSPSPPPTAAAVVAHLEPAGGTVLTAGADGPLVWWTTLGNGSVTVLAFDPTIAPLTGWDGLPALLYGLLSPALQTQAVQRGMPMGLPMYANNLASFVDTLPARAFPAWQTVALLLGGFALLAGPVAHLTLGRLRRRQWAWVVVPLLALVAAAGIYGVGVGALGRDVLTSVVSRVQLNADGTARQSLSLGVFAPSRRGINIIVPAETAVQVSDAVNPWGMGGPWQAGIGSEPPYRVLMGRNTEVQFLDTSTRMHAVSWQQPLTAVGSIDATIVAEQQRLVGSVTNNTPYHLDNAAVIMGQTAGRLGAMAPGETVALDMQLLSDSRMGGGYNIARQIFGQPRTPPPHSGFPHSVWDLYENPPNDADMQRRVRLINQLFERGRYGDSALPLSFVAFSEEPIGDLELPSLHPRSIYHLSLIEQPLSLHLEPGPFVLAGGLVVPELVDVSSGGWGTSSTPTMTWIELAGGHVEYAYRPPLPATAIVERITVTTAVVSGAMGGGPLPDRAEAPDQEHFSIYNWRQAAWEPLPTGREEIDLDAAGYVAADHTVRLRIDAKGTPVRFVVPTVAFEGRVSP